MTKESRRWAFQKAFSDHMLLNLIEEELEAVTDASELNQKTSDEPTPTAENPITSFEYVAEERYYVSGDRPTSWVKGKEILGPFEGKQRQ